MKYLGFMMDTENQIANFTGRNPLSHFFASFDGYCTLKHMSLSSAYIKNRGSGHMRYLFKENALLSSR